MNVLGLDIGTTSVSAALLDTLTGEVKHTKTIAHKSFLPAVKGFERMQDPAIIMKIVFAAADELIAECPDIRVIGLTGQMHGIVYTDPDGDAISPLYTWQDGRGNAKEENGLSLCEELKNRYGTPFYTGYGLVSHLYNLRHGLVPENAAKVCTIMDYLGMKLTGRKTPLMHSSNAASLGFYNIHTGTFCRDILEKEGVDVSILPDISASIEILGTYKGIPVTLALGDNQASFLGSVRHANDEILVNMGTGGQISVLSDRIVEGEDIETRPFMDAYYLIAGSSLCGGRSYALLADFFTSCADWMGVKDLDVYGLMDQMLSSYQAKNPPIVNTAFSGTRDFPDRTGSITNITPDNFLPADFTYGMINGIAAELYERYSVMLKTMDAHHTRMVASGNALRKNAHMQKRFVDTFQMELSLSTRSEEAACGTAIAGSTAVSDRTWKQELGI